MALTLILQMKRRSIKKLSIWRTRKWLMIDIYKLLRTQRSQWRRN